MNSIDEKIGDYKEAINKNATVDSAIDYAKRVVNGEVVAGNKLILSCQRFLRDLDSQGASGFRFSRNRAEKALRFFPLFCVHIKGELAGKPIILEDWQAFIVVNIFGWFQKSHSGKWVRRFRYVYIEVARKNGKSTLLSGIALYMLAIDGEGGAEVYCAAVDKDQAKIVWESAAAMVDKSPALSEIIKITRSKNLIEIEANFSKFVPLSKDTKKMDGLNVHCGILDEVHAHPDRQVFDLVKDGMSSREQPLLAMITTAGTNKLGICFEQRKHLVSILNQHVDDAESDRYFGAIFDIDDDDDPYDESAWKKANPCLGKSKYIDAMRSSASLSKVSALAKINFMIKDLNRWLSGGLRWMDLNKWNKCHQEFEENYKLLPCWVGVDLSISGDVTAIIKLFKGYSRFYVETELYYPRDSLEKLSTEKSQLFKRWEKEGHLKIIEGFMVDQDVIESRIVEIENELNVIEVCLDPWKSHQLTKRLDDKDIEAVHIAQTIKNFSESMQTIEGFVHEEKLFHDGNPAMTWMIGNVVVNVDRNENIFPNKAEDDRENKIDGPTALFTAMIRALIGEENIQPNIRVL